MCNADCLGFAGVHVEGRDGSSGTGLLTLLQLDFAKLLFILLQVVLQGEEESLGVFGSHDDTAAHFGFLHAGHHADEVENELAGRVGEDGEVAIHALCHLGLQLNLKLLVLLFVCHRNVYIICIKWCKVMDIFWIIRNFAPLFW